MANTLRYLREGARSWRRRRAQALIILLTLTLALALATSFYSILHSVVLQQLPYDRPGELGLIWTTYPELGVFNGTSSYANFEDIRKRSRSFEELAVFDPYSGTMNDGAAARQLSVVRVSSNLFRLLGAPFVLGRAFTEDEVSSDNRVLVISEGLWKSSFGGRSDILRRTVSIDGVQRRIVGVIGGAFQFPETNAQAWEPASLTPGWSEVKARRGGDSWRIVGRVIGGRVDRAQEELDRIAAALTRLDPANRGLGLRWESLADEIVSTPIRRTLWLVFGAILMLLMIAAADVAALFSVLQSAKAPEYALRSALGADPHALRCLQLGEIGSLVGASGPLALLLSFPLTPLLRTLAPPSTPRLESVRVPPEALFFALVLSGLLIVMILLARGRFVSPWNAPCSGPANRTATSHRAVIKRMNWLLMGQVALLIVLLWSTGLISQSLLNALQEDPGFQARGVTLAQIALPREVETANRAFLMRRILDEVNALPGVEASAINDFYIGGNPNSVVTVERGANAGQGRRLNLSIDAITDGYFDVVGTPLLEGRPLNSALEEPHPVVVNRTLSRLLWPDRPAVGERLRFGDSAESPWRRVVGVVADSRRRGLDREPLPQAFLPHAESPARLMNLVIRSSMDRALLSQLLRERVNGIDTRVPVYRVRSLSEDLLRGQDLRRFAASLLGIFAAASLALAGLGLYALLSLRLSSQLREIGIRRAIGARNWQILWELSRKILVWMVAGVLTGLLACLWFGELFSGLLYHVRPEDALNLGLTALVMTATAAGAIGPVARRALRTDPVAILREE